MIVKYRLLYGCNKQLFQKNRVAVNRKLKELSFIVHTALYECDILLHIKTRKARSLVTKLKRVNQVLTKLAKELS